MNDDTEQCGYETPNGPCKNPATEDNSCWIESHGGHVNGHGRDFSISEDDHNDILQAARVGLSKSGCARAAGVSHTELNRYLDAHDDFRSAFAQARGKGETELVKRGLYDSDADSSMAKFLLASSFDYKKTEKREHMGEDGGAIEVSSDVVTVTEDGDDA